MRRDVYVVGIAALTACCWLALAAWPGGQLFVCGAGGITEIVPAWSIGRAMSLLTMWTVMSAGMMLPCAVVEIVRTRVAAGRLLEVSITRAVAVAIAGAPSQWALESLGVMNNGILIGGATTQALLVLVAAIAVGMHLRRGGCWASPSAMIALQFAGGSMNLGWMAVVSAGMLVLAIAEPILRRQNEPLIKSSLLIQTE